MVSYRFHNVFGLSAETVEGQPVLGFTKDQGIDEADVYFFDGYVINIPFCKILIGDVYGIIDED
jgi:hypothetical protein